MDNGPSSPVQTSSAGFQYSGNPDFRGYLAAQAAGGNQLAKAALGVAGNDGGINQGSLKNYGTILNGQGNAQAEQQKQAALTDYVNQSYKTFGGFQGHVLGDTTTAPSSATSTVDPQVAALLGGQINNVNSEISNLDPQKAVGLQNVTDQYNKGLNAENQGFQNTQDNHNTQAGRTVSDLMQAKGNIATNVRQTTQGVQKLLGLAGSGTSSASQDEAPFAASQAGAQQQQGVQQTYGQNLQNLDTAFNQTKQQHDTNLTDLSQQQFQGQQKVGGDINSTRASLLSTLANLTSSRDNYAGKTVAQATADTLPFMAQLAQLHSQQAGFSQQYQNPIAPKAPVAYTPPSLNSYNYGSIGAPTAAPSAAPTAQNTPFLAPMAQKQMPGVPALG